MSERLFGIETEYALTAVDVRGAALDRGPVLRRMMQLARRKHANLLDTTGRGIFLANGARLYVDWPDHPEFSTPEVANPWDAVRYTHAGDHILADLAQEFGAPRGGVADVFLLRCNVDYSGSGTTWGCHESYLHRSDPKTLPAQIIPHLVTRLIYTGAGGFDSTFLPGAEFTLSPRVYHLAHTVSGESTHSRGIFHTKDEPMAARGYHRLHILCGESLCSEIAAWLKVATTALVVALIDSDVQPGAGVQLKAPLDAMLRFAADPTCRARAETTHGGTLSALDIQRHYLGLARAHVAAPAMPPWAAEACARWEEMLDRLEHAPAAVSTSLDWAIKLALFQRRAHQRGIEWTTVADWNNAARTLGRSLAPVIRQQPTEAPAAQGSLFAGAMRPPGRALRRRGLAASDFDAFSGLRAELFEIDTRFAQLGERGIFPALDRAGVLSHRVAGVENVERAVAQPPDIGRARLRGHWVRELGGGRGQFMCDWQAVMDWERSRQIDLSDPFATRADWQPWNPGGLQRAGRSLTSGRLDL